MSCISFQITVGPKTKADRSSHPLQIELRLRAGHRFKQQCPEQRTRYSRLQLHEQSAMLFPKTYRKMVSVRLCQFLQINLTPLHKFYYRTRKMRFLSLLNSECRPP